ncbi:hypothetical protein L3X38_033194 [Prunus dulcis]|uniref:Uncharacterized protein n=1 Tax=Prunus dulcis TaxID=3755 RepID=A0AAD4VHL7_PRUDU|nr:hypothetical protein L3X38_033194 [Prunus dulcis]
MGLENFGIFLDQNCRILGICRKYRIRHFWISDLSESDFFENGFDLAWVCLDTSLLDLHVVHIDFHSFANLLLKDLIHEPLVGCSGVLQPKGHDLVAVGPSLDDERDLRLVILMHQDLMIARVGVHEAEQLIARSGIHELVNSRQWEVVFRACFIEVGVIDTDSPFALFLFRHQNNVGQPLRVGDLFNDLGACRSRLQ